MKKNRNVENYEQLEKNVENAHYHGTINIEHKSLYFALSTLFLAILPFTATHFAAVPQQSIWNIFAHHLKKNLTSRLTMIRKLFTKSIKFKKCHSNDVTNQTKLSEETSPVQVQTGIKTPTF